MAFEHKSVLLYETVDSLNIRPDGIYVDGTLGGAGHSSRIAAKLTTDGLHPNDLGHEILAGEIGDFLKGLAE